MVRASLFHCNATCITNFINMLKISVSLKRKEEPQKNLLLYFYTTTILKANYNYFSLSQTTF